VRQNETTKALVINQPDACPRTTLPETKTFDRRFVAVGRRWQNQRVKRGAAHARDLASLSNGRESQKFDLLRIDASGARWNFHRRGGCRAPIVCRRLLHTPAYSQKISNGIVTESKASIRSGVEII
jgi:hypothetical protein